MEKIQISKLEYFEFLNNIPITQLNKCMKIDNKNDFNYYIKDNYKYIMKTNLKPLYNIYYKIKIK